MRVVLALLLTLLFSAHALQAAAVPFAARIGTERIVLDAPPGFSDTTDLASPRLQELAESQTSASNRILLFALTDMDVRRFTSGEQIDARRYVIAVTPRVMERERVTPQAFSAYVSDSLRELGTAAAEGDVLKYLDKQPHGKASLLAELRKEPAVVSVLQGTRLPQPQGGFFSTAKPPQYVFATATILLLRGKVLRLDVYSGIDAASDVDWLKGITERWIAELVRLNR